LKKLQNENLHDLYSSENNIRHIRQTDEGRSTLWEMRNVCKILVYKSEERDQFLGLGLESRIILISNLIYVTKFIWLSVASNDIF
jgi:hypothetical protein